MLWKTVVFAAMLLAVGAQKKKGSRSHCSLTVSHRQDCGYPGIADNECIARGCCWLPCEGCDKRIPWCFYSAGMLAPRCQVHTDDKRDCGFFGMKQSECLMRGCCWVPSNIPGDPWCFYEAEDIWSPTPQSTFPPTEAGTEGEVRLVDGDSEMSGRVEIYHAGVWGTVCDDNFNAEAAAVVCRQLGFPTSAAIAHDSAFYGPGTGSIHMDGFSCDGDEQTLADCFAGMGNTFGEHDCSHSEDVGVECSGAATGGPSTPGITGARGDVRIVNGGLSWGRLEVFDGSSWGSVCDDGFYQEEASVACRQLGYQYGISHHEAHYGESSLDILLDGVSCEGDEDSIADCVHNAWGVHDCSHIEDVGIECFDTSPTTPPPPELVLITGHSPNVGLLGVVYNGELGSVCDDAFGSEEAEVACRQLGLPGPGRVVGHSEAQVWSPTVTAPIHMDDVVCSGSESYLWDCRFDGWGSHNCDHSEDVALVCGEEDVGSGTETVETEGALRLVSGPDSTAGRVEIYHQGQWGTVCDDGFEAEEAKVICRALGMSGGIARKSAYFGQGEGPVWMDQLMCLGDEISLEACPFDGWGVTNCGHQEDAGVECTH